MPQHDVMTGGRGPVSEMSEAQKKEFEAGWWDVQIRKESRSADKCMLDSGPAEELQKAKASQDVWDCVSTLGNSPLNASEQRRERKTLVHSCVRLSVLSAKTIHIQYF